MHANALGTDCDTALVKASICFLVRASGGTTAVLGVYTNLQTCAYTTWHISRTFILWSALSRARSHVSLPLSAVRHNSYLTPPTAMRIGIREHADTGRVGVHGSG